MVVNLRAPGSLESLTKVVATQTFFENPETLCVGDPIWRIFLELGWNHQLVDFRPQSHSLMWDASRLFSMPGTGDATAWTMFFFVMIHLLHLFICLFIHGWLFLLIWWFVYLFTLLYCVELKQDPIIYVVEFRWLLSGCSSLNFRRNRRPFMCGKNAKSMPCSSTTSFTLFWSCHSWAYIPWFSAPMFWPQWWFWKSHCTTQEDRWTTCARQKQ